MVEYVMKIKSFTDEEACKKVSEVNKLLKSFRSFKINVSQSSEYYLNFLEESIHIIAEAKYEALITPVLTSFVECRYGKNCELQVVNAEKKQDRK